MRKLLLVICGIVVPFTLYSQTFSGRVINNSTDKPLEMASVSLLQTDSMTIAFSMANSSGRFSVAVPDGKKAKFICVSCMGYAQKWIPVQGYNEGGEIRLNPKDIMIKEVKYVSKRLTQSGDTLTYSVSGFRMPHDRTIGDILKKLPGIEVSSDGQIKYQDKPINKFYIEGMNLLDGKYNLATNNLSAKAVKSVQVLENHQAIAALKGKNFSENAALNLVLEDKAKARILGTVDVGLGVEDKNGNALWDNRLLSMLFNSRMQNLSMYKNNNTGNDVSQELKVLTIDRINQLTLADESNRLSSLSVGSPDLDQNRHYNNDSHLLTFNNLWRIKKETDLRVQASYFHDNEKQDGSSFTTYYLPGKTLNIDENMHAVHSKDEIEGSVTYNVNNAKVYLKNNLKFNLNFADNKGWMLTNGKLTDQNSDLDKQVFSNDFQLIRNYGKNVFRICSLNKYSSLPQHLTITPGQYPDWLNGGNEYDFMQQDLRLRSFVSHTYSSFQHKLLGMYIDYKAGLKLKSQSLHSALGISGNNFPEALKDSFLNRSRFTETDLYLTPSISYQNYSFKGKAEVSTNLNSLYQHNGTMNKYSGTENHLLFEPNIYLEYTLSALWKINGSFSYQHNYSDVYSLYPGYVFTSYRSASANGNDISLSKFMNMNISVDFKNPIKGFFFDLSGNYSPGHRNTLMSSKFNGILQQTVCLKKNVDSKNYGINSTISKTFSFWKTFFRLNSFYSASEDTQLWSEVLTRFRSESISSSLSVTMQPCRFVDWEISSSYFYYRMKTLVPQETEYTPVRNFQHKFSFNVFPSDNWQFKWTSEYYHSSDKNLKSSFFSDLSLSYIIKNNELQFSAMNLLNNTNYERKSIGTLSEYLSVNRLRSRQFVLKYLFSF